MGKNRRYFIWFDTGIGLEGTFELECKFENR